MADVGSDPFVMITKRTFSDRGLPNPVFRKMHAEVAKRTFSLSFKSVRIDHKADLLQRPDIALVSGSGLYDPGFSSFERTKIPGVGATETGLG